MSEKKTFPAEFRVLLLAGFVGILVTAGSLCGMAALMVSRGFSGAMAVPFATAAVGIGSFCSGWTAAFCKKEKGLFCGTLQGIVLAVLLFVLVLPSGVFFENTDLLRFAVVVLCGCAGGFLGVRTPGRKKLR